MFVVVRSFTDISDKGRLYAVGDVFPADGVKVSKRRINSLLTGQNANGKVYIREENESDAPDDTEKVEE